MKFLMIVKPPGAEPALVAVEGVVYARKVVIQWESAYLEIPLSFDARDCVYGDVLLAMLDPAAKTVTALPRPLVQADPRRDPAVASARGARVQSLKTGAAELALATRRILGADFSKIDPQTLVSELQDLTERFSAAGTPAVALAGARTVFAFDFAKVKALEGKHKRDTLIRAKLTGPAGSTHVVALGDTGAKISLMSERAQKAIGAKPFTEIPILALGTQHSVPVAEVVVEIPGREPRKVPVGVYQNLKADVGRDFLADRGIVNYYQEEI